MLDFDILPPLFEAIRQADIAKVYELIADTSVIEQPFNGRTPLHYAIMLNKIEIVRALLMKGANYNAICLNRSPLHAAIASCEPAIVNMLLAHKADCSMLVLGETPFEMAIHDKQLLMAQAIEKINPTLANECILKLVKNNIHTENKTLSTLLADRPLGSWHPIWYQALVDKLPTVFKGEDEEYYFSLRIRCEQYALCKTQNEQQYILQKIEELLKAIKAHVTDPTGTTIPFERLHGMDLIKHIYLFEAQPLSALCAKYLPVPTSLKFYPNDVPRFIVEREHQQKMTITQFLHKNRDQSFAVVEKKLINIQRHFRMKLRQQEEKLRIQKQIPTALQPMNRLTEQPLYKPQCCHAMLADRIVNAAKKIKVIEQIMHRTEKSSVAAILDDSLYGRKTLLRKMIDFVPAALSEADASNGDANVICFGANHGSIDDIAEGEIEFYFDFEKLSFIANKSPHCAFFKQKDLEFILNKTRRINLDKKSVLCFDHTEQKDDEEEGYAYLYAYISQISPENPNDILNYDITSKLLQHELISYDLENIHSRLILNFFKLLESFVDTNTGLEKQALNIFYDIIDKMDDTQLSELLLNIGKNASDTMEFNFYGAFKIEFPALCKIRNRTTEFELHVENFIHHMNELSSKECLMEFSNTLDELPSLFKSYRFLDYLAEHIENPQILSEISSLRMACLSPEWYPSQHKQLNTKRAIDCYLPLTKKQKCNTTSHR